MNPHAMTMLKILSNPSMAPAKPKKPKLPEPEAPPHLIIAVHPAVAIGTKAPNDPTDPQQMMESERNAVGPSPSRRVPVKLGLTRNPIKTQKG